MFASGNHSALFALQTKCVSIAAFRYLFRFRSAIVWPLIVWLSAVQVYTSTLLCKVANRMQTLALVQTPSEETLSSLGAASSSLSLSSSSLSFVRRK